MRKVNPPIEIGARNGMIVITAMPDEHTLEIACDCGKTRQMKRRVFWAVRSCGCQRFCGRPEDRYKGLEMLKLPLNKCPVWKKHAAPPAQRPRMSSAAALADLADGGAW